MFFSFFSSFGWNWDPWTDTCCPVPSNPGFGNTSTIALKGVVVRVAIAQEGQFLTCTAKLDGLFEEVPIHNITQSLHTYFPYPYFSWQTWETIARWYPKIGSKKSRQIHRCVFWRRPAEIRPAAAQMARSARSQGGSGHPTPKKSWWKIPRMDGKMW